MQVQTRWHAAIVLALLASCGSHTLQSMVPDGSPSGTGGAGGNGRITGDPGTVDAGGAGGTGAASGSSRRGAAGSAGTTGQGGGGTGGTLSSGTGGTAGSGNGGGTGGIGATNGRGGTGESCGGVMPAIPPLCPSLCGNGVRDTCLAQTFGFCPPTYWTEACDGTDFGTDTCLKHGFAGGPLTCTAKCAIEDSNCAECFALDASLVRCGPARVSAERKGFLAVAATDAEVGIGLVGYDANNDATVSFARLSPTLDPIGSVTVFDDHVPPDAYFPAFGDLAAAALPLGWVLAVIGRSDLSLRAIAVDGTETGRVVVDTMPNVGSLTFPLLAGQQSGGPLLVWSAGMVLRASVIAADGRSVTTPVDLPTSDVAGYDPPSAAFVGDAFYVVFSIQTMADGSALRIVRVGVDGTIASTNDALPGEPMFGVNLAAGANELLLAYSGPPTGVLGDQPVTLWRRLTTTGQELTSRSPLAGPSMGLGPSLAFGDDTVVFVLGLDGLSISFARIANDGSIVTPPHDIVRAPYLGYRAARRGPDVVVAWGGPGGLQIARVTP